MLRQAMASMAVVWAYLGPVGAGPACAHPVAIVTEVEGQVRMIAGARVSRPEVADPVERDAALVLERDARIVLAYPGAGSVWELRGPGRFVARAQAVEAPAGSGSAARRDLAPALRALQVRPEGTTIQGSAAMRGAGSLELQASGPTGSQWTSDPIRLCWRALGPQWSYRVRLIDDDGAVRFEARTFESFLELPATLALRADTPYLWHLQAIGPNHESAEAAGEFRRLDAGREPALLRAEGRPGLDATGSVLVRIALRQRGFAPQAPPGCPRGAPP